MIIFLTVVYLAILAVCVKLNFITLTPFWKVSPVIWVMILTVVFFIPMQWGAPVGPLTMYQSIQSIVPNVSGKVLEVVAKPLTPMKKGDIIYKIDPTPFQATVSDLKAQLALAKLRVSQSTKLAKVSAGSKYELQKNKSQVVSLEAKLRNAQWNLSETDVKAPVDGHVVALTLRPGQRVTTIPMASAVAFVMDEQLGLLMGVNQNQLRYVKVGQPAEVVLKLFPGETFKAKVNRIIYDTSQGQMKPSGTITAISGAQPSGLYGVVLDLEPGQLDNLWIDQIPGGAVGKSAIYTEAAATSHVIRKVMLRMDAWLNYLKP